MFVKKKNIQQKKVKFFSWKNKISIFKIQKQKIQNFLFFFFFFSFLASCEQTKKTRHSTHHTNVSSSIIFVWLRKKIKIKIKNLVEKSSWMRCTSDTCMYMLLYIFLHISLQFFYFYIIYFPPTFHHTKLFFFSCFNYKVFSLFLSSRVYNTFFSCLFFFSCFCSKKTTEEKKNLFFKKVSYFFFSLHYSLSTTFFFGNNKTKQNETKK